jgi:hypothetical protein
MINIKRLLQSYCSTFFLIAILAFCLSAFPSVVFAQTTTGSTTTTIGTMLQGLMSDVYRPFGILLAGCSYLLGFWLVFLGLNRLKEASDRDGKGSIVEGLSRLVGGSFLVALPDTLGAGLISLYGTITGAPITTGVSVGAVTSCMNTSGGMGNSSPLQCVFSNLATNVVPIATVVLLGLMYLVGVFLVVSAIYSIATSQSHGHKQHPRGWIMKMIIGFVMCNTGGLMYSLSNTLGISGATITTSGLSSGSSLLSYTASGTTGTLATYATTIGYVFQVLVVFGVISVWRGLVYLRAHAEGNSHGGGVGMGLTHIGGGVALANAKWFVCLVLTTFIGNGLNFC